MTGLVTILKNLDDEKLTTAEVAELVGVHPRTVVRWCNRGELPCTTTLGGHRRIRWADVAPLIS